MMNSSKGQTLWKTATRNYVTQHIAELPTLMQSIAAEFWNQRVNGSIIPLIAQDVISVPASQAFVERLFSMCGMLTVGRRNRTRLSKSLQIRAWLKVNYNETVIYSIL